MRPIAIKKYHLETLAKRKAKGRPIKIGGGDSGFITGSAVHHRHMRYADENDFTAMSIEESNDEQVENK